MDRELLEQCIDELRAKLKKKNKALNICIDNEFQLLQRLADLQDQLQDKDAVISTLQERLKAYDAR